MFILVGYASAHGSTREVARRIAARLKERGHRVDVRPADQVEDVGGYDAVVIGSAIYNQAWLPDAAALMHRNLGPLARRPVWLFSVGTVGDHSSAIGPRITRTLRRLADDRKDIAHYRDAVRPRDHRTFAGVIQRGDWGLLGRVLFKAMGGRYGDHRDWAEIDAWAVGIADELGPQERAPPPLYA